jgi:hypothetical protein
MKNTFGLNVRNDERWSSRRKHARRREKK